MRKIPLCLLRLRSDEVARSKTKNMNIRLGVHWVLTELFKKKTTTGRMLKGLYNAED